MSHLDPDALAAKAVGEPTTADEQRHLDTCDECSLELAVLEHTVAVGRSTVDEIGLETPPERVWEGIRADVDRLQAIDAATAADVAATEAAIAEKTSTARRRRRRLPLMFALAASLAVILTVAGAAWLLRPTPTVELAAATLDAFPDHPGAVGEARVVELGDGEREVDVTLDASVPGDGYREVWLIKADASALVSLGVLQGDRGSFPVPAGIDITDYSLVDISQETVDGDPGHSGDSIVRGKLEAV